MSKLPLIVANILALATFSTGVKASVVGVMPQAALIHQLQIGLEVDLQEYSLPQYLLLKLPRGNRPELMTSTFFSAWTQLTFTVCTQAINKQQVPTNLATASEVKAWLMSIAVKSWSTAPKATEIEAAYNAGFSPIYTGISRDQQLAMSCSFALSSPNLYAVTE